MKRRLIGVAFATALVLAGGRAGAAGFWERAERDYQKSATAKRVNDVHKIADLLEAYYQRAARLPLDQYIPASGALTVIVGASDVERELQPRGNPLGSEPATVASAEMLAALRAELGPAVTLPVDPQKASNGAPNAYYVRFKPNGQYLVAGFLRQPHAHAAEVAPTVFGYALRSRDGHWGLLWDRARLTSQVSAGEREAIRIAGEAEDRRFSQWVDRARD